MGLGRIAAPDDLRLRIADVVEAIGHCAIAPGIGYAGDRRRMADARLVVGIVSSPERADLAKEIGAFIGEFRRSEPINRIRPGFFADRDQLVADLVNRLVPADPGPLAADELQRVFEPPLAGDEFAHGAPLAQCEPRLIGLSQLGSCPIQTPLATSAVTVQPTAQCVQMLLRVVDLRTRRWRRSGLGLPHAAERQGAQRRETAGGQPRAAQEGAPIDAMIRLARQGGELAPRRLTFRSLDQHGRLPQLGYRLTR